VVHLEI